MTRSLSAVSSLAMTRLINTVVATVITPVLAATMATVTIYTATIFTVTFYTASSKAFAGDYCLAVRGNGELAPAHWGGIAKLVERMGFPEAMSGGSSASVSLFLLDSVSLNPILGDKDSEVGKQRASLLIKSFESYLESIALRPEWQSALNMAAEFQTKGGGQGQNFATWIQDLYANDPDKLIHLLLVNRTQIEKSLAFAVEMGLLNEETFLPLYTGLAELAKPPLPGTPAMAHAQATARVKFFAGEAINAITLLGKFNAETDANLFFRSGIVNFKKFGGTLGKAANFYAGKEWPASLKRKANDFFDKCATLAAGRTWNEMRKTDPTCDLDFKALISDYEFLALPKQAKSRELDLIGTGIASFPSTSVISGNAYIEAKSLIAAYAQALDPNFGAKISKLVQDPNDLKFGYWGTTAQLTAIQKNLKQPFTDSKGRKFDFTRDEKSKRVFSLGHASWLEALRSSPAEPGLASLQEISSPSGKVISAGGWSDLHPGALLKAYGCETTVYLTRRGGESLFAQGVAKRILGIDEVPWAQISTSDDMKAANVVRNNQGLSAAKASIWNNLFNLGNSESSYNTALKVFDAVVCTDWNRFNIQENGAVSGMIEESYRAPLAISNLKSSLGKSAADLGWSIVSHADNSFDASLGYRPYAGCLPF